MDYVDLESPENNYKEILEKMNKWIEKMNK